MRTVLLSLALAGVAVCAEPSKVSVREAGFVPFSDGDASPRLVGETFKVEYLPTGEVRSGQPRGLVTHLRTRSAFEVFPRAQGRKLVVEIPVTAELRTGSYELTVELVYDAVRVVQLPRVTFHVTAPDPLESLPRRPLAISQQRAAGAQYRLLGFFPVNYDFLATSVWVADQEGVIGGFDRGDNLWPGDVVVRQAAFADWWVPVSLRPGFRTTIVWTDGGVTHASTTRVVDPSTSAVEMSIVE